MLRSEERNKFGSIAHHLNKIQFYVSLICGNVIHSTGVKPYPEGNAQNRLQLGYRHYYCNRHGLF